MSQSRSIERPLIILTHLIIMKIVQSTHGCVLVITVEHARDDYSSKIQPFFSHFDNGRAPSINAQVSGPLTVASHGTKINSLVAKKTYLIFFMEDDDSIAGALDPSSMPHPVQTFWPSYGSAHDRPVLALSRSTGTFHVGLDTFKVGMVVSCKYLDAKGRSCGWYRLV